MKQSEKMKEKFRVSKERLKKWERSFRADFQMRPTKEDVALAPEQVQICYRNCWKIKAYFESKARSNSSISSGVSGKKRENCDEVNKITQKSELQHQSFNKPQKTSVTSVKQVPKISVKKVHDNRAILNLFVQVSKCHRNPWKSHFLPQKVPQSTIWIGSSLK